MADGTVNIKATHISGATSTIQLGSDVENMHIASEFVKTNREGLSEIRAMDDFGQISDIVCTFVPTCTPKNPFYLKWINSCAGWTYQMFSCTQKITNVLAKVETYKPYHSSYEEKAHRLESGRHSLKTGFQYTEPYSAEMRSEITIGCTYDSILHRTRLAEIIFSPNVQYWDVDAQCWVGVIIDKQSVSVDTDSVVGAFELKVQGFDVDYQI